MPTKTAQCKTVEDASPLLVTMDGAPVWRATVEPIRTRIARPVVPVVSSVVGMVCHDGGPSPIVETFEIFDSAEHVQPAEDGDKDSRSIAVVIVSGALWTGSVRYVGADHVVIGEGTARVTGTKGVAAAMVAARHMAVCQAESAARKVRSRVRESVRVIGAGEPFGPSQSALTPADLPAVRAAVMRRTFGNASGVQLVAGKGTGRSTSAYVKAGLTASGMPASDWTVDDAVSDALIILAGWRTDGLPTGLAAVLADVTEQAEAEAKAVLSDGMATPWQAGAEAREIRQAAALRCERAIIGSAARDGLRGETGATRPLAAARALAAWHGSHGADPRTEDVASVVNGPAVPALPWSEIVKGEATVTGRGGKRNRSVTTSCPVAVRVKGAGGYLMTGAGGADLSGLLAVGPDGTLRYPLLARLLLADNEGHEGKGKSAASGVLAVLRSLGIAVNGRNRSAVKSALVAEWGTFAGSQDTGTEDAATCLAALMDAAVLAR